MAVGRNDPCPCGSGKKYKHCCLPATQIVSLDRARADRAYDALMPRLAAYAGERKFEQVVAAALVEFFGGVLPDDAEDEDMDMALDWAVFGHRSAKLGMTLCEHFAAHAKGLAAEEQAMVAGWASALPGFFHVTELNAREVHLRRLWSHESMVVTASETGLKTGDLIAAWLLPVRSGLRFGFHLFPFPVEASRPLEHLLREELFILRRQRPSATWDDLFRICWPRLVDDAFLAAGFGQEVLTVRRANGPAVRGSPQRDPHWVAVADRIDQEMRERAAPPREVEGALRLWWDVVALLRPRVTRIETWAGGLLYALLNRIYGFDIRQVDLAQEIGVSTATISAKSREIEEGLDLEQYDPRYVDLLHPFVRTQWRLEWMNLPPITAPPSIPLEEWNEPSFRTVFEDGPRTKSDPVSRAEELVDEAWESQGRRRIQLANKAIKLWPDAADAYVILANEELNQGNFVEARKLYQEGAEAGKRALGQEFMTENAGHFWGLSETRPYMRALSGLAHCHWMLGEREAAVAQYEEMLRLSPNDNQGNRHTLASRLLDMDDDKRLGRLLSAYPEDGMADFTYTRALWGFRQEGPGKRADRFLKTALKGNPHVPAFLMGERPLPPEPPAYIGLGDDQEAIAYALEFGDAWRRSTGALQWLASRTGR